MANKPSKPGWWWIDLPGYYGIECVKVIHGCECLEAFIGPTGNSYKFSEINSEFYRHEWIGPALSHEGAEQLRHERDALKNQIELLEWMANAITSKKVAAHSDGGKHYVVAITKQNTFSWPGELRDGWQHFDKIKEAVK